jgi:hypothetical protein
MNKVARTVAGHHGPAAHQLAPIQTPDCCMLQRAPLTAAVIKTPGQQRSFFDAKILTDASRVVSGTDLSQESLQVVCLEPRSSSSETFDTDGRRDTSCVSSRTVTVEVLVHFLGIGVSI